MNNGSIFTGLRNRHFIAQENNIFVIRINSNFLLFAIVVIILEQYYIRFREAVFVQSGAKVITLLEN